MSGGAPCPILVINLRSSTARWAKASAELTAAGLAFERLEAADGRILRVRGRGVRTTRTAR